MARISIGLVVGVTLICALVIADPVAVITAAESEEETRVVATEDLVTAPAPDPRTLRQREAQRPAPRGVALRGVASWYGPGFAGRKTANGERYDPAGMTAAHRTLPFGTRVRVTNRSNGRSVILRVNDRGPFIGGRIIDLSEAAAQAIGMRRSGVATVELEIVG